MAMAGNFEIDQDRRAYNTSMEISNLFLLSDCRQLKLTTLFNPNMSLKPLNSTKASTLLDSRYLALMQKCKAFIESRTLKNGCKHIIVINSRLSKKKFQTTLFYFSPYIEEKPNETSSARQHCKSHSSMRLYFVHA